MKLAITGKGGVGKTTLAAFLINHFSKIGKRIIAVDADPDANLASALGFSDISEIVPIAEMDSLIEERTGARPGSAGSIFNINPEVEDLPEKLSLKKDNIYLMVMGTPKKGGGGCFCPESALLRALMVHLVIYRNDIVIMDMEAGIEHLGRGTAGSVDMLIVVVEPGKRSVETAQTIKKLAGDLGIKRVALVGNKIRKLSDEEFIRKSLDGEDFLGFIPFDNTLIDADMQGGAFTFDFSYSSQIDQILENVEKAL